MAVDYIDEIYKYAETVPQLKKIVEYAAVQDGFCVVREWKKVTPLLALMCSEYGKDHGVADEDNTMLNAVLRVTDCGNNLSMVESIISKQLLPIIEDYLGKYANIDAETDDRRYRLFSSISGYITVEDRERKIILHSEDDPVTEARYLAERIYRPEYQRFALLGCGLGYLARELYFISGGILDIDIYEDDMDIIAFAMQYGVLADIPEEKLQILSGENEDETIKSWIDLSENSENGRVGKFANWWYPVESSEDVRSSLAEYDLYETAKIRNENVLEQNFWKNDQLAHKLANQIIQPKCSSWIVVAGGPSLDKQLEYIRKQQGKKIIIAVTTVFRKLLEAGIRPDFITAMEANKETYRYFEGMESETIPLIMSPSLYWKCAAEYSGAKYIAPIIVNDTMAIRLYKMKLQEWKCGSTVTTLAIEAASRLGAKEIFLCGADFGYPGGYTHASGSAFRTKVNDDKKTFEVPATSGKSVLTSYDLNMFRLQVEKQVKDNPGVKFYNLSYEGALIAGTEYFNCGE